MIDPFASCPVAVFRSSIIDELLVGDDGSDRLFFAVCILFCDDWGRFEGDSFTLARNMGVPHEYAKARLESLQKRGVIHWYTVATRTRMVGEIAHWDQLPGKTHRKAHPTLRKGGEYPDRAGNVPLGRKARARHAAR